MSRSPSALDEIVAQSLKPPVVIDQDISDPVSKLTQDEVQTNLEIEKSKTDESAGEDIGQEPEAEVMPVIQVSDVNTNSNNNNSNVINMTI